MAVALLLTRLTWFVDPGTVHYISADYLTRTAVDDYAAWYASTVLGGALDQWAEVATAAQLDAWLDQRPHR